jgi:hypothetical protein
MLEKEGFDSVLEEVCKIPQGDPLYRLVRAQFDVSHNL